MMTTTKINPQIIAVSSGADYGKTSVIKKIFAMLNDQFAVHVEDCSASNDGNDICKIVTIRDIKIGIKSAGDVGDDVKEALEEFIKAECQLIVCATRTKSETVYAVCEYENTHSIEWHAPITLQNPGVFTTATQEINRANARSAWNIFKEIQEFVYINGK